MGDDFSDMRKQSKRSEYLTGAIIGLGIGVLLFHRVIFGAELTPEDVDLVAKTVQAEAGNQDFMGKRLVAAVILNRIDNTTFPDTAEDVLSQQGQFSTYKALPHTEATYLDRLAVNMEIKERSDAEIVFLRAGKYGCGKPAYKYGDHYFSTMK